MSTYNLSRDLSLNSNSTLLSTQSRSKHKTYYATVLVHFFFTLGRYERITYIQQFIIWNKCLQI